MGAESCPQNWRVRYATPPEEHSMQKRNVYNANDRPFTVIVDGQLMIKQVLNHRKGGQTIVTRSRVLRIGVQDMQLLPKNHPMQKRNVYNAKGRPSTVIVYGQLVIL